MPAKNSNTGFKSLFASKLDEDEGVGGVGAVGGAEFTPGNGYKYHIFTSPGTLKVEKGGSVDVCIVAAGGGGGNAYMGPSSRAYVGGGGGAGGMKQLYDQTWEIGTYTITLGIGGRGGGYPNYATNGGNSYINSPTISQPVYTATGGGYGGRFPGQNGQPGGSGGGGAPSNGSGGPGIAGQGNNGSSGTYSPPYYYRSGGGGGAGASASSSTGGAGLAAFNGDTGIPSSYGTPGPSPGRYFAGGGAGAYSVASNRYSQTGGVGGGGSGYGGPGTINTGGGGCANSSRQINMGGSGGPGIVIVRYAIG